jgi:hypothetical protein
MDITVDRGQACTMCATRGQVLASQAFHRKGAVDSILAGDDGAIPSRRSMTAPSPP